MVLVLNSFKPEQETTIQTTKVIRNDEGSPAGEWLVPPEVRMDFISTSYVILGLGIEGFWLSACFRGTQKDTGSGGRPF